MLILNDRETMRTGEVRYRMSRQVAKGSREALCITLAFPAEMQLPSAFRGSDERKYAARAILHQRRKLMKAVRGARGGC